MPARCVVQAGRNPSASLRLFCFPYAGAGASCFRKLQAGLPESVDVIRVQLPGREERLAEAPCDDLTHLVETLVGELEPMVRGRSVFLGYSLGALLAFEVARALQVAGRPLQQLIACACAAPSSLRPVPELEEGEDALLERLRQLGATPAKVLADRDAMRVLLPAIRADLRLVDRYRYDAGPLLRCPVRALGGASDDAVPYADLLAWRRHTAGPFEATVVPGDHFFMHGSAERFRELVLTALGLPPISVPEPAAAPLSS